MKTAHKLLNKVAVMRSPRGHDGPSKTAGVAPRVYWRSENPYLIELVIDRNPIFIMRSNSRAISVCNSVKFSTYKIYL